MRVKAKFKGADGSEGYRTGEVYVFEFVIRNRCELPHSEVIVIKPYGLSPVSPVVYESLKSFSNNWEIL